MQANPVGLFYFQKLHQKDLSDPQDKPWTVSHKLWAKGLDRGKAVLPGPPCEPLPCQQQHGVKVMLLLAHMFALHVCTVLYLVPRMHTHTQLVPVAGRVLHRLSWAAT